MNIELSKDEHKMLVDALELSFNSVSRYAQCLETGRGGWSKSPEMALKQEKRAEEIHALWMKVIEHGL